MRVCGDEKINNTRYNGSVETRSIAPTVLVIFGITGDLARRKLLPAIFDLERKGLLPEQTRIIGFSRREFSTEAFVEFLREAMRERLTGASVEEVERFFARFSYCQASFDDPASYKRLGGHIGALEKEFGVCANKLFYLAVPPDLYETIFRQLADSGRGIPCGGEEGWARVLVEKPFGRDLQTAIALDELLSALFKEEQIFRIDHYLAKEAVQNMIMFRFSNLLFEPIWNRTYVERVEIRLFEQGDVSGRGAFFDGVGMLRDVGQNHLLQMLAVVAMEHPQTYTAERIRVSRAAVQEKIRVTSGTVRGQYAGYRSEQNVAPDSSTETYFRIEAEIHNKRWRGVPFVLEAGKALAETKSEIVVRFKPPASCLAHEAGSTCDHRNVLTFRIQPDEGITVRFWITKGGLTNELEAKELAFSYAAAANTEPLSDAYERLLYDALRGDQTLFAATEEVRAAWRFVTPILRAWGQDKIPLQIYDPGSEPSSFLNLKS